MMNPSWPEAHVRHVTVPVEDDYDRPYPRPDVLQISAALSELERLDGMGALAADEAAHVRVLMAALGRMGACSLAEAFPPRCSDRQPHAPHSYLVPRGRIRCYGRQADELEETRR